MESCDDDDHHLDDYDYDEDDNDDLDGGYNDRRKAVTLDFFSRYIPILLYVSGWGGGRVVSKYGDDPMSRS